MNRFENEIVLKKDVETYVFRFDGQSRHALVAVAGRFAADRELSFTWHDAALVCRQARNEVVRPAEAPRMPSASRFA